MRQDLQVSDVPAVSEASVSPENGPRVIDIRELGREVLVVKGQARVEIVRVFEGDVPVLKISILADPQESFIVSRDGNPPAEVKPDGTTGFSMAKQSAAREPSRVILAPT